MLSFLILFPLINLISLGFFGFLLGHRGATFMTKFCLSSLLLYTIGLWLIWVYNFQGTQISEIDIILGPWLDIPPLLVDWNFLCDSITIAMLSIITVVSFVVHLYSLQYMATDPHICRFISFLSLFTLFMLLLVTSGNFLQLFLGWEGVGICSFLLITFWYTRLQANKAALKAMIVNRVGDVGLLLGLVATYNLFLSLDYNVVFPISGFFSFEKTQILTLDVNSYSLITIFFLIGVAGKSAQFGLHTWLPDAMEGPSPVSALIHAATMVTAGIFLVVRGASLFEYSSSGLFWTALLGALTAIFGGSCATAQYDLKKVIAYSTCSQLGYMLLCCGFSEYATGLYHLVNHAFFKALLFLTAGNIIHSMSGEQDIRKMGGLTKVLPATYSLFLLGSLSLMGIPYLSGFFSKDFIIEVAGVSYTLVGGFIHLIVIFVTALTAFYSTRLLALVFLGQPRGFYRVYQAAHESSNAMLLPLILLAIGAIFSGYFWEDLFIGFGTDFHKNSIFVHPYHDSVMYPEFILFYIKNIPVICVLGGTVAALWCYGKLSWKWQNNYKAQRIFFFFNNKWFIDKIYNHLFVKRLLQGAYSFGVIILDKGILELLGPTGLYTMLHNGNKLIMQAQTGHIVHYVSIMFLGCIIILIMLFL